MRTLRILALSGAVAVFHLGCGNDEGDTIDNSTGGVSNSGVGGSFIVVGAPDGSRTVEGMDDCPACEAGEGCVSVAVSLAADDSSQPWVLWPDAADGVGALRASVTISGETWQRTTEQVDLNAATGSLDLALCSGTGSGTLSVFFDENDNAGEAATTSSDYLDSCGTDRAVQIQVTAGKTFEVPFELGGSCD